MIPGHRLSDFALGAEEKKKITIHFLKNDSSSKTLTFFANFQNLQKFYVNCCSNSWYSRANTLNGRKKIYHSFKRPLSLEEFREKTFSKHRENVSFSLENFLPK